MAANYSQPGEFKRCRDHLDEMRVFYDYRQHHVLSTQFGFDPGVNTRVWEVLVLWIQGYPEQAERQSQEVINLANLGFGSGGRYHAHSCAQLPGKRSPIAQRQAAKSWDLRVTIKLVKPCQGQGRIDKAKSLLSAVSNGLLRVSRPPICKKH